MNCYSIFESALALIGISANDNSTADYAKRAVKLLYLVLMKYRSLSTALCGIDHKVYTLIINDLNANYPLEQRTMPCAIFTLASLLILDELPELSAELERRADELAKIMGKEGITVGSITEVH